MSTVRIYPFALVLEAPAIMTEPGGDPNSAASAGYIPGTAIRGCVARALTAGDTQEGEAKLQDLVLSGRVRYLNAYPLAGERRSLPVPLSWRRPKGHGNDGEVRDLAGCGADWPDEQLERISHRHVALGAADPVWAPLALGERVHHQRDRAKGRAWRETRPNGEKVTHGTLFSYRFLEEGQEFGGALVVEGKDGADIDARFDLVRSLLGERVFLGRSRRAGYGGAARVEWGKCKWRTREAEGVGLVSGDLDDGQAFRAILLSDYVGRNEVTGQVDPAWLSEELQRALGGRAKVEHLFSEARVVGGFNRTWGLELPQSLAARAGSVAVMRATARIPLDDVLQVERDGLGERRAEGFGRVAFWTPATRAVRVEDPRVGEPAQPPRGMPPDLVREIEQRLVDEIISREVVLKAGALGVAKEAPSGSLIGRLRTPLRGEPGLALEALRRWLGDGDGALRQRAMRQLSDCRIDAQRSLRDWLVMVVTEPLEKWYEDIGAIAERTYLVSPDSVREYLDRPGVRDRVRVLLIDAVLGGIALAGRSAEGRDGGA